jgi:hypothetical protein
LEITPAVPNGTYIGTKALSSAINKVKVVVSAMDLVALATKRDGRRVKAPIAAY